MCDCDEVKERAIELIVKARAFPQKPGKVWKFVLPKPHEYDLDARHFIDMLKWDTLSRKTFTPPPVLSKFSNDELKNLTLQDLPQMLCHSQVQY